MGGAGGTTSTPAWLDASIGATDSNGSDGIDGGALVLPETDATGGLSSLETSGRLCDAGTEVLAGGVGPCAVEALVGNSVDGAAPATSATDVIADGVGLAGNAARRCT